MSDTFKTTMTATAMDDDELIKEMRSLLISPRIDTAWYDILLEEGRKRNLINQLSEQD